MLDAAGCLRRLLSRFGLLMLLFGCGPAVLSAPFPPHPFVLANETELSALRQAIAKPGWKRDVYRTDRTGSALKPATGVRWNAGLWRQRTIEIPARGGHFHNFFCEDGNQLEVPAGQRFLPGPYRCPKCGRTYSGEKYEGGLRRLAHGWLAQAALDLALVSALEHRPDYATKSAEILLKYAAAYPGPHTNRTQGGMIYQSLDESMWLIPLAQAYDLIYGQVPPRDREPIENFLRVAAQGLQRCGLDGNWGSWHLSAAGVAGYAIGDAELVQWARANFEQQIREQLGADGLWPESVHTYHYFALQAFLHFAEAAGHAGEDLYRWEGRPGKSLAQMLRAPLQYAYPNLRLAAINDGWFQSFVPAGLYELAWARLGDPEFAWVIAHGYRPDTTPAGTVSDTIGSRREGLYALLFGADLPRHPRAPGFVSTNFPGLGICTLRSTNGAMMTFDYGPFLGHGHRDKMGVTLFAGGKLWAADYGTPGYGASILRWYQSAFAHNTVVVDGQDQKPTKENQASLWLGDASGEGAQSETREAYPGVTFRRTVWRRGGLFVVADRLTSDRPHTYDFYLHADGEFNLAGKQAAATPVTNLVSWIESASAREPATELSGQWTAKGGGLGFWMSGSGEITPIVGRCPAETGLHQIPLLIARQHGATAEFITVLFPFTHGRPGSVERRGRDLRIRNGSDSMILHLPEDGVKPSVIGSF